MLGAGVGLTRLLDRPQAAAVAEFHAAEHAADSTTHVATHVLSVDSALVRRAAVDSARAVHFERLAADLQAKLHTIAVPDTCKPIVVLADSALAAKDSALAASSARGDSLSKGLDSTRAALAASVASAKRLEAAATTVVSASKPSLLSRLVPHPGIGITAGLDPLGQPRVVTGITLGWTF